MQIYRGAVPFIAIPIIRLLAIIFFPGIVRWLLQLAGASM